MEYLSIPNSDTNLVDGNIVKLNDVSDKLWILHHGWYSYSAELYFGWYICSIEDKEILPVMLPTLSKIILVSSTSSGLKPDYPIPPKCCPIDGHSRYLPPIYPPCPPYPEPERPAIFTKDYEKMLQGAFITVSSIEERDALKDKIELTDGKIVKVNDDTENGTYYYWDSSAEEWVITPFAFEDDLALWSVVEVDNQEGE